jgi:hypothetical protein
MPDRGALTEVQLFAYLLEAALTNGKLRGTGSGAKNPKGVSGFKVSATQDAISPKQQLTSRKRRKTKLLGEKKYSTTLYAEMGDSFQADWDEVIKAALGGKFVDVALVDSMNTLTGFNFTGGPAMPIVLATMPDGTKQALPVASHAAGAAVYAMKPAAIPTDVKNPIDTTGAIYYVDPTAQEASFQLQSNYDNEPDGKKRIGLGCAIAKLLLKTALGDVLGFDMQFDGADWLPDFDAEHVSALADPGRTTNQFLSHMGVVYCQAVTPAPTLSDLEAKGIEFDMAPTHVNRQAITPRQPIGTKSVGSSIASRRRGKHFDSGITIQLHYYDPAWDTLRQAPELAANQRQIFFEFFNGAPQGTATKRMAGWFPCVEIDEEPVDADDGGLLGDSLKFNPLERTLTGMTTSPFYLAFFGE